MADGSLHAGLKRPPGPLSQAALAAAGRTFALRVVKELVRKHHGALIYAGGDDTLALVPRESALALARELEAAFRRPEQDGELLMGPRATLSAAVVVAHQNEHLAEVIHTAQQTLKQVAKGAYGRDAFAIRVLKRSGPASISGLHWRAKVDGREVDCAAALDTAREAVAAGALTPGLLGDLRRALPALGASPGGSLDGGVRPLPPAPAELIAAELQRLTRRHRVKDNPLADRAVEALGELYRGATVALLEEEHGIPRFCPAAPRPTAWDIVHGLFHAAEFLAREDEE